MNLRMAILLLIIAASGACSKLSNKAFDPKADEAAIRAVMASQQIAWNNGNLEEFMKGYWKSDSLQFMSLRGVNRGWNATLEGYKKGYPDREAMGTLSFEILLVKPISPGNYVVTGRYHLTRVVGPADGAFTLLFKYIDGKWVAVYDHTC
jgi:hypothetical protein